MTRLVAVLTVVMFAGVGLTQSSEATIRSKCTAEWPGDFEMQSYCQRQQQQAVRELQQLHATNGGIPQKAFRTALRSCVQDWPNDYEMQAYCLRQQIRGY